MQSGEMNTVKAARVKTAQQGSGCGLGSLCRLGSHSLPGTADDLQVIRAVKHLPFDLPGFPAQ